MTSVVSSVQQRKTGNAASNSSSTTTTTSSSTDERITTTTQPSYSLPPPPPRSLDDFLDEATEHTSGDGIAWHHQRYWLVFLSLGMANSSDATEILCLSYILAQPDFKESMLGDESAAASRAGALAAAVFLGMLLGGLWVGAVGDSVGRRPTLLVGLTLNAGFGLISAGSSVVEMMMVWRFLAGLGIGAMVPPLFSLCSELSPAKHRGFWVAVAASFWMVGSLYVAIVGWWLLGGAQSSGWRVFAVWCAVPCTVALVMVYLFVPESPRFLTLRGHDEEAVRVVQRLAETLSYTGPPWTLEEFQSYKCNHLQQSQVVASNMLDGNLSWFQWVKTSFIDFFEATALLFTTPGLSRTTWALQVVWFSLSFGSYGLTTWINTLFVRVHLENVYFNALLFALSNLPGNLLSALLMDRTGRSSMLVGSLFAAALSLLIFAYVVRADNEFSGEEALPKGWIVVAACAFQCFSISAWNAIDVLTSELFPTAVRSTGLGICAATGRVSAMLAQFFNGASVEDHPARLLVVAALALLTGALTPLVLLPRNADRTGRAVEDRVIVASSIIFEESGEPFQSGYDAVPREDNASLQIDQASSA